MKVLPKPGGVQRRGGLGLGVRWWWTVNIPTRAVGVQATLLTNLGKGAGQGFATIAWDPVSEPTPPATYKSLLKKHLCLGFRIAGDTALSKNIHESVSAQIRKNFAKSKWRVSPYFLHSQ